MSDEYTAIRLYSASDGTVAYLMKLIRYGTYLALQHNQEKLDLKLLSTAFEKYVHADKPDKANPFNVDDFEIDSGQASPTILEVGATNNRLKSKSKTKKMSASDIFRNK